MLLIMGQTRTDEIITARAAYPISERTACWWCWLQWLRRTGRIGP